MEKRESDIGSQHGHRDRCDSQRRRVQFNLLDLVGCRGSHHLWSQPPSRDKRRCEQQRPVHQRCTRPHKGQQQTRRNNGNHSCEAGEQPEFRIRLDEFSLRAHSRRHQRRLRDGIGFLQHQGGKHKWKKFESISILCHQQQQHRPQHGHNLDHQSPTPRHPIDQRSNQRRYEEKRSKTDRKEQQDLGPGCIQFDTEEERVGERHDHCRVTRHHQCVRDRKAGELRHRRRSGRWS